MLSNRPNPLVAAADAGARRLAAALAGPAGLAVGGGRGGFGGGTPNPTVTALQTAIDSNSPDQMKTALANFRAARKQAQDKLTAAQDELKKVLTVKQEVVALQSGLIN